MAFSKVHVQFKNGSVAKGKKVELSINGAFAKTSYTDGSGTAVIEHQGHGAGKVYVNGKHVGNLRAPGETAVFV